ncbi:hypothetical protein GKG47_11945 [Lactonifactor sp. BIOML-A3]|uniref:hypothetical protein n=1 Tax=unclassified Lactonifactor TaxID=2636670 RepID=UPI0012B0AF47|nr:MULTISPECIES: hypothetical protein [unclassified Lactonifactor]MSA01028.1 hypothetical protein [Lactonifactor sp. BIOML-A5]MSA10326.1 hypothetical protein [Lactonifactor sp. BIOML-A4]MSA13136.1 hypothetical protein [Lactonifactor sp. BIOML-A3]MSA19298.1 hypothetical protein [Lactonifactor sp. BIOML-A2]MSA38375.1 hypothetical protein [Lactonifactor sp. BIOML-A1]
MKIKNSDILGFYNYAPGIMDKSIPRPLYTAIKINLDTLNNAAKCYAEEQQKIVRQYAEKDTNGADIVVDGNYKITDPENYKNEIEELLNIEVEFNIQTVTEEILNRCDENNKYDALTGREYQAIEFMTVYQE